MDNSADANALTEPTVRRPAEIGELFSAEQQSQLDRLLREEDSRREAEVGPTDSEIIPQVYAPLSRLVEQDAEASAALQNLDEIKRKARDRDRITKLKAFAVLERKRTAWDITHPSLFPDVKPGINIFGAEYDYEIRTDIQGAPEITANRLDGSFGVACVGRYNGGSDWGTAGVGRVLEATVSGIAHVRVAMGYNWQWSIRASGGFDAYTMGQYKVVVQDHETGAVLGPEGVRTTLFWECKSDDDGGADGSGTTWPPDMECSVSLMAGQVFDVCFMAHVSNTQSGGGYLFGESFADGQLSAQPPFFVVQMGT
ncbi:hypothetical protein ABZ770_40060 [Streptomyces sp. NPDC006654]|uniref:hypothetical protein n=1 Tax=Streptomyces sp. NPDC006654 TaxID=3156897 RepID=UPI0033D03A17